MLCLLHIELLCSVYPPFPSNRISSLSCSHTMQQTFFSLCMSGIVLVEFADYGCSIKYDTEFTPNKKDCGWNIYCLNGTHVLEVRCVYCFRTRSYDTRELFSWLCKFYCNINVVVHITYCCFRLIFVSILTL